MVKVLDFDKPNELKAALERVKRDSESLIEYQKVLAQIRRRYFEALVVEGFSEDEALILCAEPLFQ